MRKQIKSDVFAGFHNSNLESARARLIKGAAYQDLSTVWIVATRGMIPDKVVASWFSVMRPMNQRILGPIFMSKMEVGNAYNRAVELILANPQLKQFKYMLTAEEDNLPPPDGLLKLYENMDKFDVVGGLYWTKGEGGQPMIYGDPKVMPRNFIPQVPIPECVQPCNGLGMGWTLFKLSMFRKMPSPWFQTYQEWDRQKGMGQFTQDLFFFNNACQEGFKFASDNRVKVGHLDPETGTVW